MYRLHGGQSRGRADCLLLLMLCCNRDVCRGSAEIFHESSVRSAVRMCCLGTESSDLNLWKQSKNLRNSFETFFHTHFSSRNMSWLQEQQHHASFSSRKWTKKISNLTLTTAVQDITRIFCKTRRRSRLKRSKTGQKTTHLQSE